MAYDMQHLDDIEMAEQILNVLVLDIDYGDPDDDLPDMIQQFADRLGSHDIDGPLTDIEKYLHVFCPEYHQDDDERHLRNVYGCRTLKRDLTLRIQDWINDAITARDGD